VRQLVLDGPACPSVEDKALPFREPFDEKGLSDSSPTPHEPDTPLVRAVPPLLETRELVIPIDECQS
jgi:hypothetical protein